MGKRLVGHISRVHPAKSENFYEDDPPVRAAELRGLIRDLTTALKNRNHALAESVKLQSHYAGLLNQYDGGQRLQFANSQEWEARLRNLRQKAAK